MQLIREKKILRTINILAIIAIALTVGYISIGLTKSNYSYLLSKRMPSILAIIVSGGAIAFASIIFQTISNNRILTPSVLGLDSIYSFFQTMVVFMFGTESIVMINKNINFILALFGMVMLSMLLFKFMFARENTGIMQLLLVGIIVGTLFSSLTSFMQVLIDPNEYLTIQNKLVASFNNVNTEILILSTLIILGIIPFIYDDIKLLDVMSLGQDQAINLGVDYRRLTKKMLIVVTLLIATSTALVGPVTFLGLIVVNITYEVINSYKHKYLIIASILISICSLIFGSIIVDKIFSFNTTLSIIINFIGGVYFLFLLVRENKL